MFGAALLLKACTLDCIPQLQISTCHEIKSHLKAFIDQAPAT